jgi:two-component system sensor histidine kinase PilS (NtrC family)
VQEWQRARGFSTTVLSVAAAGVDVQASFARLSAETRVATLVFLEDVAVLRQRAQQLKLASLGRLTASIAHEVRNPLGAISHAGQLLSESPALDDEERRLTAIIEEQSRRVNRIVEDILRISRRRQARTERVDLYRWLGDFRSEFLLHYNLSPPDIALELDAGPIEAGMDPDQLHQVLWNLCENGLRYSRGTPLLLIRGGIQRDTGRPFVEVVDRGPGVAAEIREQLFEPFFTTEAQGTGLGLYVARELCEANQALLQLRYAGPGGTCFRIDFAHPQRQHAIS